MCFHDQIASLYEMTEYCGLIIAGIAILANKDFCI